MKTRAKTKTGAEAAIEAVSNTATRMEAAGEGVSPFLMEMNQMLLVMRRNKINFSILQGVITLRAREKNHISLSELAAAMGVTTAAVTNVADQMERKGLAKRTVNPLDRRLIWISLTQRGKAFSDWLENAVSPRSSAGQAQQIQASA